MTAPTSRVVRVFISSTFRDFGVERDLLMKRVFPELRRRARDRFVEVIGVDLRWGITEAQSQKGETLPICLREIERSRPYFIGLLGERYGWTPEAGQYPENLLAQQPWLAEHAGGKSVTELEILYGVLNAPEMAGRAYFYFRDAAWSEGRGADFRSEGTDERAKLARLKERIRGSQFPVAEYPTPEAVADRIAEDLWTLIDAEYPADAVPDEFERERRWHEIYASEKRRHFVGREEELRSLGQFLTDPTPKRVLEHSVDSDAGRGATYLVEGDSGKGKSALVATAIDRHRRERPNDLVFEYYFGATPEAKDVEHLRAQLREFVARLERAAGWSVPEEAQDRGAERELYELLLRGRALAARSGGRFVVVVDGIDRLSEPGREGSWIPQPPPAGCALMVVYVAQEWGTWAWDERVRLRELPVADTREVVRARLGHVGRKLSSGQLERISVELEPLHAVILADELALVPRHEDLPAALESLLAPVESDEFIELVLARLEHEFGRECLHRVLAALFVVRSGLSETELASYAALSPLEWSRLRLSLGGLVSERGDCVVLDAEDAVVAVACRCLQVDLPEDLRTVLIPPDVGHLARFPIQCDALEIELESSLLESVHWHDRTVHFRPGSSLERAFAAIAPHGVECEKRGRTWCLSFPPSPAALLSAVRCLAEEPGVRRIQGVPWLAPRLGGWSFGALDAAKRVCDWACDLPDRRRAFEIMREFPLCRELRARLLHADALLEEVLATPVAGDGSLIATIRDATGAEDKRIWERLAWCARSGEFEARNLPESDRLGLLQVACDVAPSERGHREGLICALEQEVLRTAVQPARQERFLRLLVRQLSWRCDHAMSPEDRSVWERRYSEACAGLSRAINVQSVRPSVEALEYELRAVASAAVLSGASADEIEREIECRVAEVLKQRADEQFEIRVREGIALIDGIGGRKFSPAALVRNLEWLCTKGRERVSKLGQHLVDFCGLSHKLGDSDGAINLLTELEGWIYTQVRVLEHEPMPYEQGGFSYTNSPQVFRMEWDLRLAQGYAAIGNHGKAHELSVSVVLANRELEALRATNETIELLEQDTMRLAERVVAVSSHLAAPRGETVEGLLRLAEVVRHNALDWNVRQETLDALIEALRATKHWRQAFELEQLRVELLRTHRPRSEELARALFRLGIRMFEWDWKRCGAFLTESVECEVDRPSEDFKEWRRQICVYIAACQRNVLAQSLVNVMSWSQAGLVGILIGLHLGIAIGCVGALAAAIVGQVTYRYDGTSHLAYLFALCVAAGVAFGVLSGLLALAALVGFVVIVYRLKEVAPKNPYRPRRVQGSARRPASAGADGRNTAGFMRNQVRGGVESRLRGAASASC